MESHAAAGQTARFADHLTVVTARTAGALAASRYDGLLLFSGTRRPVYRDDCKPDPPTFRNFLAAAESNTISSEIAFLIVSIISEVSN